MVRVEAAGHALGSGLEQCRRCCFRPLFVYLHEGSLERICNKEICCSIHAGEIRGDVKRRDYPQRAQDRDQVQALAGGETGQVHPGLMWAGLIQARQPDLYHL